MPAPRRASRSTRSAAEDRPGAAAGEAGSGLVSAWAGFVVFLALLLFAVQVLSNLYATSVVTAVAYDAARRVASTQGGGGEHDRAEGDARRLLGRYAERVTFDWSGSDEDQVVLRVQAKNRRVMLPALGGSSPFAELDRTVRVRAERFR